MKKTGLLVSIVMPSFNQVAFLEEAVRSVLDQKGMDVELLVMDPGSTDGSRDLLMRLKEEYGGRLLLYLEPDKGQSDAVNRGMGQARGNLLGWINSDDRLRPGALEKVVQWLDGPDPAWLYGSAGMIDAMGRPCSKLVVRYKRWRGKHFSRFRLLTENFIPQMAVFWNRAMWHSAGGLDLRKDLDMDYDLWLRFARFASPTILYETLADFRVHGGSKGSRLTGAQLDAAYATALWHAGELGVAGRLALIVHKLLGLRTRIAYWWMKP
jgi:glycosyltransferase involved in cell wall biosynthesis